MRPRRGADSRPVLLAFVLIFLPMAAASARPASGAPVMGAAASESPAFASGEQAAGTPPSHASARPGPWNTNTPAIPWGRLLSGTLIVVALICGGVFALKRLNGGAPLNRGRYMEVLEARPVGRNVQLILVKVAGRVLLLAFGGDSVTPVAELSEDELPQAQAHAAGLEGFRSLLRKLTGTAH